MLRQAIAGGHDEVHPHIGALLAEPGCVAAAHSCGVAVTAWTVNRSRALRRLASLGVDTVITDVPVKAQAIAAMVASRPAATRTVTPRAG